MSKREKIQRLTAALRKYRASLADCVGDKWATAEEQRSAVSSIVSSIRSQLRGLGVEY